MKIHRFIAVAGAGAAIVGMSMFGLGATAYADAAIVQYTVDANTTLSLAYATTDATALTNGAAVTLPATTVTDSRNGDVRLWATTVTASNLTLASNPPIDKSAVAFTAALGSNSGAGVATLNTPAGTVSMVNDEIGTVYVYTVSATLTAPANLHAGTYAGTVTQTVS